MTFNRLQLLRNKPIKIERDLEGTYFYIQGPTIGKLYDSEKLFMTVQILLMDDGELKSFLNIKNSKESKSEIINWMVSVSKSKKEIFEGFTEIIPNIELHNNILQIDKTPISNNEWNKIKNILEIIMGQKDYKDIPKEKEEDLSPAEKRMKELEAKVQNKKQKQEIKETGEDKHILEDIMIAITYEFGFDIDQMMNMNYFTLIWYYAYTSKIHIYRINQFAVSSGMVKKINTDYFTNIK